MAHRTFYKLDELTNFKNYMSIENRLVLITSVSRASFESRNFVYVPDAVLNYPFGTQTDFKSALTPPTSRTNCDSRMADRKFKKMLVR